MRDKGSHNKIGEYLKHKRETLNESLAEVSGAVEIDIDTLQRIETGAENPSEDILVLLMSHFDVDESEARRLLALAGYKEEAQDQPFDEQMAKQIFMLMPLNTQVMYADNVEVTVSEHGVVVSFLQPGPNGQAMPISRIGMSQALCEKLITTIEAAQKPAQPRLLSEPAEQ